MLSHANDSRTIVIAPAVVAAAFDCLAVRGDLDPIKPAHMYLITEVLDHRGRFDAAGGGASSGRR